VNTLKRYAVLLLVVMLIASISLVSEASSWSYWQNGWTSSNNGSSNNNNNNNGGSGHTNNSSSNPWSSYWGSWNNSSNGWGWNNPQPQNPTPNPVQPADPVEPEQPQQPTQPNPQQPLQPITPKPNPVPAPSSSLTSLEKQLIDLVNQERTARGLKPLTVDMSLVRLAKEKSHEMASTGEVAHYARSKFHSILDAAGVSYKMAGENLAKAGSLTRVHNGLMNSSGHRANILSSAYTHIGVGIVKYGTMYYATEIFVGR
jgi:uncharacterized protein YkwD